MNHSILHRISFLLYPASQLVMVAVSAIWIVRLQLPEVYLWIVGLLALACIPVDFQLFREVRKTQEADILRERVRMLEEQERVQVAYRERIAADMEDIMKLRREVAEEMDEAVRRLREQEEGDAQERLSRAVDIMGSTAFRLCEHRSADAVATMKVKACEEAGVRPRLSLEIPYDVAVPAVELCAVIANLADNGLAAALRARDANELGELGGLGEPGASSASGASSEPGASGSSHEPFLSLRSSVRQGHLVIEAKKQHLRGRPPCLGRVCEAVAQAAAHLGRSPRLGAFHHLRHRATTRGIFGMRHRGRRVPRYRNHAVGLRFRRRDGRRG